MPLEAPRHLAGSLVCPAIPSTLKCGGGHGGWLAIHSGTWNQLPSHPSRNASCARSRRRLVRWHSHSHRRHASDNLLSTPTNLRPRPRTAHASTASQDARGLQGLANYLTSSGHVRLSGSRSTLSAASLSQLYTRSTRAACNLHKLTTCTLAAGLSQLSQQACVSLRKRSCAGGSRLSPVRIRITTRTRNSGLHLQSSLPPCRVSRALAASSQFE